MTNQLSFLLALASFCAVVTSNAFAAESCEEGCPSATESGFSIFTKDSGTDIRCCCIPNEQEVMESKPDSECEQL